MPLLQLSPTAQTARDVLSGTETTTTYTVDYLNRDGYLEQATTWNRDAEKRVKTLTHNDKDGASTETFAYDANGDVISDVIARGSDIGKETSYVYNALGKIYQVKGNHGQVLTYAYDGNGNVLSVTDALGHKTSYVYDALNRVVGVTNATGGVTSYAYDAGDHVIGVEDPRGLVTSYEWDGLGQLWQRVSPDSGTDNFTYDGYGRLVDTAYPSGSHTTYSYDAINRLTGRVAGGTSTQTFAYDDCAHGVGRLCSAADATDTTTYSYTPEGWVAARAFSFTNGPVYDIGYAYDDMGHLTQVAYPDGNQAIYYYTDGAVSQVNLQVGTYLVVGVNGISYRPMDLAMSGWTSYNGLTNRIDYDSDLRPSSITVSGVESLAFSYDAANRLTHITNGLDSSMTQSLGYDALGRMVSESSGADNESYSYDADGNRTNQVVNGVATTFEIAANSNRLENSMTPQGQHAINHSYGYDAEGDLTTWDIFSDAPAPNPPQLFFYNGFNQRWGSDVNGLFTWQDISPQGQRLRKYTTDTKTYFVPAPGGALQAEDQNGDWMDYVWLNGRVVTVISNGGVFPIASDQTGRPLALTHPTTKAILWQAQGLPFDRTITGNSWGNFNVGFPGQYYDSEDGLWHNGARDYDASLGRYIEADPLGLGGGINSYVYADNNPISNVDPLGLCDYCKYASHAPSPQAYQAAGYGLRAASMLGGIGGVAFNLGALTNFRRGGAMDAQRYGADPSYANYAYGVEMSANGMPLGGALFAAQFVAENTGAEASYAADRVNPSFNSAYYAPDNNYPGLPTGNVDAIEQGYHDQANGTLCTNN